MATFIRALRISALTFTSTALVFLLFSLVSGIWPEFPYIDELGIGIPLAILLACLVVCVWIVIAGHAISNHASLISIGSGIAIMLSGFYLGESGPFDEEYALVAMIAGGFSLLAGLACQAVVSWGKWGVVATALGIVALLLFLPTLVWIAGVREGLEAPPPAVEVAPPPATKEDVSPPSSVVDRLQELLPDYPWPPETPSWTFPIIQGGFDTTMSLYDVARRLDNALRDANYYEYSFYRAPGGFVLVTRLEAIDPDGSYLNDGRRFLLPSDDRDFDFGEYIRSLFFAPKGYYRFIAFVVTDAPYVKSPETLSETDALTRLQEGANALPRDFQDIRFSPDHRLDALIYEFRKAGSDDDVETLVPGRIPPESHLTHSGLREPLDHYLP